MNIPKLNLIYFFHLKLIQENLKLEKMFDTYIWHIKTEYCFSKVDGVRQ